MGPQIERIPYRSDIIIRKRERDPGDKIESVDGTDYTINRGHQLGCN